MIRSNIDEYQLDIDNCEIESREEQRKQRVEHRFSCDPNASDYKRFDDRIHYEPSFWISFDGAVEKGWLQFRDANQNNLIPSYINQAEIPSFTHQSNLVLILTILVTLFIVAYLHFKKNLFSLLHRGTKKRVK